VPVSAVLTHAHGDHCNGAALVTRDGGKILASSPAAKEIVSGPHTYPAMFTCSTWGDIDPPAITETVTRPVTYELGGPRVEIIPCPTTAHTAGDLVVWLPREGVLFTGDLVFSGVTPLAFSGSVTGWLEALGWLDSFQARRLVPGHGPVAAADSPALTAMRDYLRWLLDAVSRGDSPDFDALEAEARTRWPLWDDSERHAVNLRIAHAETRHDALDLDAAMRAMLRSAGGPITLDI
jgi:cyclase